MVPVRQLVHFFADHLPGAGRTQIVKFVYLSDLTARRYLGRPLSSLKYILANYGPFDAEILDALDQLSAEGFLDARKIDYPGGKSGYSYTATGKALPYAFDDVTQAIVRYVITKYGTVPLRELLEDVVYETDPMKDATERRAYGEPLAMDLVDNHDRICGLELDRIWESVRQLERGELRPLREVADELRAADNARK